MTNFEQPKSSMILYQTEDGRTRIQCRFEDETVWLTQPLMAELFQVTPQNVTLHLKAIYAEGELDEAATCKEYLQVRTEGGRRITRPRPVDADFEQVAKQLQNIPKPKKLEPPKP